MQELIKNFTKLRNFTTLDEDKYIFETQDRKQVRIFYFEEKLDMNQFYKTYQILSQENPSVHHIIFIHNMITIQMKKMKLYKDILRVELFSETELKRMLIGNKFIPIHKQVCSHTQEKIFKKFGKDNLPKILNTDPVVRLYDFELNSVIEIQRPDEIYYRIVVADEIRSF
jgi:DNA-directed RNA polymerase subunit H (RpoH/RPB5)